jgi:hypothetical protein
LWIWRPVRLELEEDDFGEEMSAYAADEKLPEESKPRAE